MLSHSWGTRPRLLEHNVTFITGVKLPNVGNCTDLKDNLIDKIRSGL